ncbi:hypothetical protein B0T17DRAFT_619648 [Bombardia bombarda]|uniref:4-coumarate--CoA ligase n=1 Tax=Bombardia bombarda TaxID=252184 RepID=A0AA39WIN8_9PEZI|nr:hypothetical protein B0T17DRAFT_619648 [Bombardia bombarda]
MTIVKSRFTVPVPRCSLQQWVFGSACDPLPDRKAFIDPDRPDKHFLTLTDYRLLSKRVALGLQKAGLKTGDRVLLFSGNNLFFPSVFLGVIMAGGIFTGANPTFVLRELAHQLSDSAATFLIVAASALPTALEAAKTAGLPRDHIFVFDNGKAGGSDGTRHWTELLSGNLAQAEKWAWTEPLDPDNTTCCLNYSSGTTGVPKGVEISHRSYIANGVGVVFNSLRHPEQPAKRERARLLCFLPLYHAYGQTYFAVNMPHMHTPVYIMPSFDFVKMLEHVQRFRITTLACVPPVVVALSKSPLTTKYDVSSVEEIFSGAAPLSSEVADAVHDIFTSAFSSTATTTTKKYPFLLRQGWGMTEMTCSTTFWDPDVRTPQLPGVGELIANCAGKLVALDGETPIAKPGERGEVWVTGPTMMRGYWRNPKATADTITVDKDGTRWFKTGDIGYWDEFKPGAILHIVDRLKELIKVKGNQVAPAELEGVLLEHPEIVDAAVVGVTIKGREMPRAYVLKAEGSKISEREVAEWMAGRVAPYKRLTGGVVFADAIPKNPSGKILRKILRERAKEEVGDIDPRAAKLS